MTRLPAGNGRRLSPWDQLPYWELPRITTFTNLGSAIVVAGANPRRGALIFSATGAVNIFLLPGSNVSTGNGIMLTAQTPVQTFTHADFGPVVQAEWWAVPQGAGGNLTVIESIFSSWPGD